MKTYKYTVLLAQKKGGGYSALCPAIPRCRARGDTKREVIDNIKLSIRHRLDLLAARGEPIPRDGDRA